MASKTLFKSTRGKSMPPADAVNEAGGRAYRLSPEAALATYAVTGCLHGTFYASAQAQLDQVLRLAQRVEPAFVARTAVHARTQSHMKDLPALLTAVLSVRSPELLGPVFERVIDSPRMLRTFVQIMRSGVVGRKSLGSLPKRLVRQKLEAMSDEQLFRASVGNDPSIADLIRMVRPKPATPRREALMGYLIGQDDVDRDRLPELVKQFEAYKAAADRSKLEVPDVPLQMLTALGLHRRQWSQIARQASWQQTRMNLNAFLRHGVLQDDKMVRLLTRRLRKPELIRRSRVLPYQLLVAYRHAAEAMPGPIRSALQDALDVSLQNVPAITGQVYVCVDISGSMHSPVTGYRRGATTAVRCIDVAALVAAALLRTNPQTVVVPFESKAIAPESVGLNPRDSVMTNADKLARLPCGGTNCSAALQLLNQRRATGDLVVYVSDNESWVDSPIHGHWGGGPTQTLAQWAAFKQRSPRAKMICIDVQPYATTQAKERDDVINVAGFSDAVFGLIAAVAHGDATRDHWVRQIQATELG
jgi:60 kDa SS-A/Ro ribonucleoprotein